MIFQVPETSPEDRQVLDLITEQRQQLRHHVNQNPVRWTGFLRQNAFARAVQGSNSIEGFDASVDETNEIIDHERPEAVAEETYRALSGYQNAMTYVLQVHDDPLFDLNPQFLKSLHFMMMSYDLTKRPGQWRPGAVFVVNEQSGEMVYEGPDSDLVPALIDEMIEQIQNPAEVSPTIRAAMAHLNLTMIHPFKDGNGRLARAVQTLVMAREGIVSPILSSIEEWLGRNTTAYYATLTGVGQGPWHPEHDASPWIRFCLRAHYQQAATLTKRNREIGLVWEQIDRQIKLNSLPTRVETALIHAAFGLRVRNNRYRSDNEISGVVASRDLRKLCEHGLLTAVGERRGRYYIASDLLKQIREKARDKRKAGDPYQIIKADTQPALPGIA